MVTYIAPCLACIYSLLKVHGLHVFLNIIFTTRKLQKLLAQFFLFFPSEHLLKCVAEKRVLQRKRKIPREDVRTVEFLECNTGMSREMACGVCIIDVSVVGLLVWAYLSWVRV